MYCLIFVCGLAISTDEERRMCVRHSTSYLDINTICTLNCDVGKYHLRHLTPAKYLRSKIHNVKMFIYETLIVVVLTMSFCPTKHRESSN